MTPTAIVERGRLRALLGIVCLVTAVLAGFLVLAAHFIGDPGLLGFAWAFAMLNTCAYIAVVRRDPPYARTYRVLITQAIVSMLATVFFGTLNELPPIAIAMLAAPFTIVLLVTGIAALARARLTSNWHNTALGMLVALAILAAVGFTAFGAWKDDPLGLGAGWGFGFLAAVMVAAVLFRHLRRCGDEPRSGDDIVITLGLALLLIVVSVIGAAGALYFAAGWWKLLALPYILFTIYGGRCGSRCFVT